MARLTRAADSREGDKVHELSIAENIVEIVAESLSCNGGGRLKRVKVRIGDLAGVVPESLDFCFTAITKGTDMEGAALDIERRHVVAHCENCGNDSPVEGLTFMCPSCKSTDIRVTSGNELQVVQIEVED